jgi:hypothetical protein
MVELVVRLSFGSNTEDSVTIIRSHGAPIRTNTQPISSFGEDVKAYNPTITQLAAKIANDHTAPITPTMPSCFLVAGFSVELLCLKRALPVRVMITSA